MQSRIKNIGLDFRPRNIKGALEWQRRQRAIRKENGSLRNSLGEVDDLRTKQFKALQRTGKRLLNGSELKKNALDIIIKIQKGATYEAYGR
jgi:hypothetical protein